MCSVALRRKKGSRMTESLVAYFSATGTTEHLAQTIAQSADADLFEIEPEQPYTAADLDWNDSASRSSREMRDKSSRPAVASHVENMDQYDIIYVGFPIWWYVAPTIVNTFLEQYDLAGKTIVPFATSGGSGMGNTNDELAPSCPGAILLPGKRFGSASQAQVESWVASIERR